MKPRAFYNDNDPKACAWVRELMTDGLIMEGDVDERSITEIQPEELRGYTRIHLFCGIAGWDYALQLAGWPADRPVLTNSCPCQPFSCAGAGKGHADERHLWPEVLRLVRVLRPPVILGEQVPAAIKHGWIDGVFDGLEECGYACGALDIPACSVGAPHIRQRLYWLGHAQGIGRNGRANDEDGRRRELSSGHSGAGDGGLAHASSPRCIGPLRDAEGETRDKARVLMSGEHGEDGGLANPNGGDSGAEREQRSGGFVQQPQNEIAGGLEHAARGGEEPAEQPRRLSGVEQAGFWDDYELIPCADGKARRVESKTQCLVAGSARGVVPGGDPGVEEAQNSGEARVMRLRGYGNSLTAPVAAEFIRAVMKSMPELA